MLYNDQTTCGARVVTFKIDLEGSMKMFEITFRTTSMTRVRTRPAARTTNTAIVSWSIQIYILYL